MGVPRFGATSVGAFESTTLTVPVDEVTPVPPLATFNVPANVMVPDPTIGPPLVVRPVVPPDTWTDETVPPPGDQLRLPDPSVISA